MTAADQPTTEPSEAAVDPNPTRETETAHAALCDADEARRTDMVERMAQAAYSHPEGTPWGMSNPATKQYFREQQGRVYDALLAPAPQPAAEPCDGGCNYDSGPEETCSRHGRPVAEVWAIVDTLQRRLAEQPVADTETEVEWGVRERPLVHGVTLLSSEDDARGLARRDHGVVVTRTVTTTTTPWEEA